MIEIIVYKYTNKINGKVYIGITTRDIRIRRKEHLKDIGDGCAFHRALRKYGIHNFSFQIIDVTNNEDDLKEKEMYYIGSCNSFINSENSNGYNMTTGGEGTYGYSHTSETKALIGMMKREYYKSHVHPCIGKIQTQESREKQRRTMGGRYSGIKNPYFGKKHSEETKNIISKKAKKRCKEGKHPMLGRNLSEETKRKIGLKLKGRTIGQAQSDNQSLLFSGSNHPNSLKIICTTTSEVFDYMGEASKKYGLDRSNLTKCCKGKTKWCGVHPGTGENLKWKYIETLTFQ